MLSQGRGRDVSEIVASDARDYRDHLLDLGRAPAIVNRALTSLRLFLDAQGRQGDDNPFRKVDLVEIVERAPGALTRNEWNAVRREGEKIADRDHGLALALICLMRYAGPRVGEVAALQLPDVQLGARQGRLIVRRGKGLKHREVPLVLEAREPLQTYLDHRRKLAAVASKLEESLSPHDLRHTMAKALFDPAAYGLDRAPAPITAVQELLGHADIATTTIYTRSTHEDLARIMGEAIE